MGDGVRAAFVDGGVSMANNPALTLLQVATLQGFPFRWEMGEDNMSLVSVGTGYTVFRKAPSDIDDAWLATWASSVPDMLMQDASWQNQIILQWLSNSPTAHHIDMEMGNLDKDLLAGKPMLHYLRYNLAFTENTLNGLGLGRTFSVKDITDLAEMSNAHNRHILYDIGNAAAGQDVRDEHFG